MTKEQSLGVLSVCRDKVVVAGNSLGGYNSLALASSAPELVSGVVLLNGAGRFEDLDISAAQQSQDVVELSAIQAPGYVSAPSALFCCPIVLESSCCLCRIMSTDVWMLTPAVGNSLPTNLYFSSEWLVSMQTSITVT